MEILLLVAVGVFALWWFFFREPAPTSSSSQEAPYKVETPAVNTKTGDSVEVTPSTTAWHTAPPADTKPVTVESVAMAALDVNHDGKVNLADVKEAVKKVRKPRTPKAAPAEKPAVKKAAPKKAAAIKAKPKATRSKKA